ncbi:unnamed protein product [Notodromas monacha]|uniref:Uncharacterized protein n=1 Tax=Notodromas monacha TaxID=399045 RepID=A0A7R9BZR7_9CRUS|nr:unnamed protein product [Notodromas monacha]CAG0923675.1 unnamed protein product [Notodromas monacha]
MRRRNEQANVNVVQVQAEQAPPWLQSLADISYLEDLIGIAALDTRPSSQTIVDGLYTPSTSPPAYTLVVDGALDKPPSYSALFQETNKSRKPARDKMSTSNEESIQNIMANSSCSTSTSAARVPPDGADTTLTSLAGSALCIKEFDQHAESVGEKDMMDNSLQKMLLVAAVVLASLQAGSCLKCLHCIGPDCDRVGNRFFTDCAQNGQGIDEDWREQCVTVFHKNYEMDEVEKFPTSGGHPYLLPTSMQPLFQGV